MSEKIYFYPVWIRMWHWLNAIIIIMLIFTGVSLQYSNPNYPILKFNVAVKIHDIAGISLTLLWIFFLIGNLISVNGRYYKITGKGYLKNTAIQFKYYTIGIFQKKAPPFPINRDRKFNPLQQISYVITMYVLCFLVILTGWLLFFPEMIFHKIFGMSGIHLVDLIHVIIGFMVSLFMIIHIYFCTIGKSTWSNYKSMMNGWHETHD
ncbi:cytochrome b/b6 domain-containing protein [candidate division KSB1 bacterium]